MDKKRMKSKSNYSTNLSKELIWQHTYNGKFSVKSSYNSIVNPSATTIESRSTFGLSIPPKIQIFVWLLVQKRLLTNVNSWAKSNNWAMLQALLN